MHAVLVALVLGSPGFVAPNQQQRDDHALVLLCGSKTAPLRSILNDYAARSRSRLSLTTETDPSYIEFTSAQMSGSVKVVPRPVASKDIEPAIHASWQWAQAGRLLRAQTAYLDVAVRSQGGDVIDHNLRLTQLVAAAARTANGCAVFWGNAATVVDPKRFLAASAEADRSHLPLVLWVNFLPARLPTGAPVIHTIGLSSLELPEVILDKGRTSDEAAVERLMRISEYLLRGRLSLRDGDTVNVGPDESLSAHRIPAPWDPQETAVHLMSNKGNKH